MTVDNHDQRDPWARVHTDVLEEAEALCQGRPIGDLGRPSLAHLHGVFAGLRGSVDLAVAYLVHANRGRPRSALTYMTLGEALIRAGHLADAVNAQLSALKLSPNDAQVWASLASALHRSGKGREAAAAYHEGLTLHPADTSMHTGLGDIALHERRFKDAVRHYVNALTWGPRDVAGYIRLGQARLEQGEWSEALDVYQQGLNDAGEHVELYAGLGKALLRLGEMRSAQQMVLKALALDPRHTGANRMFLLTTELLGESHKSTGAWLNLGGALEAHGQLQDAMFAFRQALARKGTCLGAHLGLARVCSAIGDVREAIRHLEAAVGIQQDAARVHVDLGLALLRVGETARGWDELTWSRRFWSDRWLHTEKRVWDGGALNGRTVLLWGHRDIGDTIQYLRFVRLAVGQGGRVVIECQRPLLPLVRGMPEVGEVTVADGPPVSWDVHAPLHFLPAFVERARCSPPNEGPYLRAPMRLSRVWRRRLRTLRRDGSTLVGISWRSHSEGVNTRSFGVPLSELEVFPRTPGIRFVSLQRGPHIHELLSRPHGLGIECAIDGSHAFADVAAVVENVDVVVTTDLSIAHLAGALGKPTLALLAPGAPWPWPLGEDRTAWYPTIRLFRKPFHERSWRDVLTRVWEQLEGFVRRPEGESEQSPSQETTHSSRVVWRDLNPAAAAADAGYEADILEAAETICRKKLRDEPNSVYLWHVYGLLALRRRQIPRAVSCLARAIQLGGRAPCHYDGLGEALHAGGSTAQALKAFLRRLVLAPHDPVSFLKIARSLEQSGLLAASAALYDEALRLDPTCLPSMVGLASVREAQGRTQAAIDLWERGRRLDPNNIDAYRRIGWAYLRARDWAKAVAAFRRGTRVSSRCAVLRCDLGQALISMGRVEEAVCQFREALIEDPRNIEAWRRLIASLTLLGRSEQLRDAWTRVGDELHARDDLEEAREAYLAALNVSQGTAGTVDASAILTSLGRTELALAKPAEAREHLEAAVARRPDTEQAHVRLARASYLLGNPDKAWQEFRFYRTANYDRHYEQPAWNGEVSRGQTVLLWQDQGLGDAIQYLRYTPLVRRRFERLYVTCDRKLAPLVERMPAVDGVFPFGVPLPDFDVHAPLFALPRIFFGLGVSAPPNATSYLSLDPGLIQTWAARLRSAITRSTRAAQGHEMRTVGVVWGSRAGWTDARFRSMPLATLEPLAARRDIQLVSLQLGPQVSELMLAQRSLSKMVHPLNDVCTIADTGALTCALDLVVTVDTMVAHLAGALGRPVWTMLRYAADWKYMLEGERTLWYPTMRLFRQSHDGAWKGVIDAVIRALDDLGEPH